MDKMYRYAYLKNLKAVDLIDHSILSWLCKICSEG